MRQATLDLIKADTWRMNCLHGLRSMRLPDAWLVAGFVRNLVWDHLHGHVGASPLNDVDVAWFDPKAERGMDQKLEQQLARACPQIPWQVRNQAHMARRNGHAPYRNTAEAVAYYPELATCVGVRLNDDDSLECLAPYGLEAAWALTLVANPRHPQAQSLLRQRVIEKAWLQRWPRLQVDDGALDGHAPNSARRDRKQNVSSAWRG